MSDQPQPPIQSRPMPHSVEAEQVVLGSMIKGGFAAIDEARGLFPTDEVFYIPAHRTIYVELLNCRDTGIPVDLILFTQMLRDQELLDQVGGAAFVTQLFTMVPTSGLLDFYAAIVRDKHTLREVIAAAAEAARRAYEEQGEVRELLDDVQSRFTALALAGSQKSELVPIAPGVDEAINRMARAYKNRGKEVIEGLATGFFDIDRMLQGLKPQNLVIIGARPSNGKSAIMMNVVEHMVIHQQIPVAVFSLEMSYQEIADRATCSFTGLSLNDLRTGMFDHAESANDFASVREKAAPLRAAKLYIDDTPKLKIYEFQAKARRMVSRYGVKCIAVDYLQLMESTSRRAKENRALEITEITGALKATAKELNIVVLACAQLNRELEKRPMARPKLSDLRESGSIEQDADVAILLWRPVKNISKKPKDRERLAEYLEIEETELDAYSEAILAKQRNGPTGEVQLAFDGPLTRFRNVTAAQYSNDPGKRQGARKHEEDGDEDI